MEEEAVETSPFSVNAAFEQIINHSMTDLLDRIAEGPVSIEAGSEEVAVITGLAEAAATYAGYLVEVSNYLREVVAA